MTAGRVQIPLDLSDHCIETELKRLHEKSISDFFKADERTRLLIEPVIEALSDLLATVDFANMRVSFPALAGGTRAAVVLSLDAAAPTLTLNQNAIPLILKSSVSRDPT